MPRVNLLQIAPSNAKSDIISMESIPRVGDAIEIDEEVFEVRSVIWTPQNPMWEVQVRYR